MKGISWKGWFSEELLDITGVINVIQRLSGAAEIFIRARHTMAARNENGR
jgi:hypothetical protein